MTAPTDPVLERHDEAAHRRDANRAVGVSAGGLALTGSIELALAVVTGSVALLGDALHNLSDVSTSAVVFLGFRISKRKPTPGYPYGYERAERLHRAGSCARGCAQRPDGRAGAEATADTTALSDQGQITSARGVYDDGSDV